MDLQTQRKLGELNRDFYERNAASFEAKRERPWPGWTRIVDHLEHRATSGPLRVLDVGCGNARFGEFLAGKWNRGLDYVGIDNCAALLRSARAKFASTDTALCNTHAQFITADLMAGPPSDIFVRSGQPEFDLCSAFGLLHHIPGSEQRRALVEAIALATRPGGLLALSFWQFDAHERFRRKFREDRASCRPAGLCATDFGDGDHLIAWGEEGAVRYCHAARPGEIADHVADLRQLGFAVAADFESDGTERTLNRYVLFERNESTAATDA